MEAVALPDSEALIDRIANGAFLRDLAKETGIDKRRLSEQLRKHPSYKAAKEAAIEVQLDDAQIALEQSREVSDITRAREMFRAAAWRAEHEFPERWGAKAGGSGGVTVVIQRGGDVQITVSSDAHCAAPEANNALIGESERVTD